MQFILTAFIVFRLLEKRQYGIPVPPLQAALTPFIVVRSGTPHIDGAVNGTAAAQNLAARLVEDPIVESFDGLALELPVYLFIGKYLGETKGNMDPGTCVLWSGLEQ